MLSYYTSYKIILFIFSPWFDYDENLIYGDFLCIWNGYACKQHKVRKSFSLKKSLLWGQPLPGMFSIREWELIQKGAWDSGAYYMLPLTIPVVIEISSTWLLMLLLRDIYCFYWILKISCCLKIIELIYSL